MSRRSAFGTKSGEPGLVTRSAKVMMAFLGAVSFQDGSGSWVRPGAAHDIRCQRGRHDASQLNQYVS